MLSSKTPYNRKRYTPSDSALRHSKDPCQPNLRRFVEPPQDHNRPLSQPVAKSDWQRLKKSIK